MQMDKNAHKNPGAITRRSLPPCFVPLVAGRVAVLDDAQPSRAARQQRFHGVHGLRAKPSRKQGAPYQGDACGEERGSMRVEMGEANVRATSHSLVQRSYYTSKCLHFTHQGVCCSGRAPCRVPVPGRGCLRRDVVNTLCTAQNETNKCLPRHSKPTPSTSHLPCVTASVYWPLWRRLWGSFQVTTLSQSDPAFPAMLAS